MPLIALSFWDFRWFAIINLPMMETGRARISKLHDAQNAPNAFPNVVFGAISPYPTVVMVTMAHQRDSGIVLNFVLGSCNTTKVNEMKRLLIF